MGRGAPAQPRIAGEGARLRAFVDTNVLIRHLTGEPPEQAARASAALRSGETLVLVDLIVAEVVFVLESVYEVERARVAALVQAIVTFPTISVADVPLLLRTLELYEQQRIHFADAYLAASAEYSGVRRVMSFDRGLARVATIERVEPGL